MVLPQLLGPFPLPDLIPYPRQTHHLCICFSSGGVCTIEEGSAAKLLARSLEVGPVLLGPFLVSYFTAHPQLTACTSFD